MYDSIFTVLEFRILICLFCCLLILPLVCCLCAEINDRMEENKKMKLRRGNRRIKNVYNR